MQHTAEVLWPRKLKCDRITFFTDNNRINFKINLTRIHGYTDKQIHLYPVFNTLMKAYRIYEAKAVYVVKHLYGAFHNVLRDYKHL
jgi:hypothetical protein